MGGSGLSLMAWLRIDDGFASHPKVTALSFRDRWTWMAILCYCARYRTAGRLPLNIREHVAGATGKFLRECDDLGLLDHDDDGYVVHDWEQYSPKDPTGTDRQARWRALRRNDEVTGDVTDPGVTSPSTSRARVPSRPHLELADARSSRPPDELWEALEAEIGKVATRSERSRRNGILKQLREVRATAAQVAAKCAAYRQRWPNIELTDTALVKHWSHLETPAPQNGRGPSATEILNMRGKAIEA